MVGKEQAIRKVMVREWDIKLEIFEGGTISSNDKVQVPWEWVAEIEWKRK